MLGSVIAEFYVSEQLKLLQKAEVFTGLYRLGSAGMGFCSRGYYCSRVNSVPMGKEG